jgi:hypothetical protein
MTRLRSTDLVPQRLMELFGIDPSEIVWVCTPADSPAPDLSATGDAITESLTLVLARAAQAGVARIKGIADGAQIPADVARKRAPSLDAAVWERAYRRLRSGPLGRAAADLSRPLRRRINR